MGQQPGQKPIDFSSIGGIPVNPPPPTGGGIDFSSIGGKPVQPAPVAPQAAPGMLSRVYDAVVNSKPFDLLVNKPVADTLSGSANWTARHLADFSPGGWLQERLMRATGQLAPDQTLYDKVKDIATAPPTIEESKHPLIGAFTRGLSGITTDLTDTAAGMTSPVGIATMAAAPVAKAGGLAGRLAKVGGSTAAIGFGAKGAYDAATNAPDALKGDPDAIQKALGGAAMAAGGGAGLETAARDLAAGPGMFSGRMNERVAPNVTRSDMAAAAKAHDVNLDLADTTGSPVAKGVKKVVERTLGGSGTFEGNQQRNLQALEQWADDQLSSTGGQNVSRQMSGQMYKTSLQQDLDQLKTSATQKFTDLDRRLGGSPINGAQTVRAEASNILGENKSYYDAHPQMLPRDAWKNVQDLASKDNYSWSELHRLRSDIMEDYRNSPDKIKSQSEAWMQRMVKTIDDAMTNASSGLTPQDRQTFRDANEAWTQIKSTYDNPQHPYYSAIRAPGASDIYAYLDKATPEFARQVKSTLGANATQFQREFVSRLLDPKGNGVDFAGFQRRLNAVPAEYLEEMLGPQGAQQLRTLAATSKTLTDNANPSKTSDVMVKHGEMAGMASGMTASLITGNPIPAAVAIGTPMAEKATATAMTKPSIVGRLSRTQNAPSTAKSAGRFAGATGAAANSSEQAPDGYIRVRGHLRKKPQ